MLQGRKIILGITGGIAAYKCPHLVRLLVKAGAEVRVVMSDAASDFVTAKTLSVVSRNEVYTGFFDANHKWNNHVHLAEWSDLLLIAPLTANSLAKMSAGLCDNILLATWLSARSKTIVAPAMDLEMYRHETVRKNLQQVASMGVIIIPAAHGELASGLTGEGRMAEPEEIVSFVAAHISSNLPLAGKTALVNAGPTYEAIDPVRFIGNRSSGKMGIAVANRLRELGAEVTLVAGPVTEQIPAGLNVVRVESAAEMFAATTGAFTGKDIVVCCAAVSDYKPAITSETKLKKGHKLELQLEMTKDILQELGNKKTTQCLVGFALETGDLERYASEKLKKKNLDMVVANLASHDGGGIGSGRNTVTVIDSRNKISKFELKDKREVAIDIVNCICAYKGYR